MAAGWDEFKDELQPEKPSCLAVALIILSEFYFSFECDHNLLFKNTKFKLIWFLWSYYLSK